MNRCELKANTRCRHQARENACDQVAIGFYRNPVKNNAVFSLVEWTRKFEMYFIVCSSCLFLPRILISPLVFLRTDSKIYGRITLLEGSGLGRGNNGYALAAEKVYLCTGVGEFIPTYDPRKNKFGCMARSLYLEHRLKVLVRLYFSFLKTWYRLMWYLGKNVERRSFKPWLNGDARQLASTCDFIWPGLACTCVDLRRLAFTLIEIKFARK